MSLPVRRLSLRGTKEGSARFPPPAVNKGTCTGDGARRPSTEGGLGRHWGKGVIMGRASATATEDVASCTGADRGGAVVRISPPAVVMRIVLCRRPT